MDVRERNTTIHLTRRRGSLRAGTLTGWRRLGEGGTNAWEHREQNVTWAWPAEDWVALQASAWVLLFPNPSLSAPKDTRRHAFPTAGAPDKPSRP